MTLRVGVLTVCCACGDPCVVEATLTNTPQGLAVEAERFCSPECKAAIGSPCEAPGCAEVSVGTLTTTRQGATVRRHYCERHGVAGRDAPLPSSVN